MEKIIKLMKSEDPSDVVIGTFLFIKKHRNNTVCEFNKLQKLGHGQFEFPNLYIIDETDFSVCFPPHRKWKRFRVEEKNGEFILNESYE